MSDNSNEFGSFLAGFLIGGLVGAAVSLLLAPQSGEETRTLIKTKSIELKDKAVESSGEIRSKATDYAVDFRTRAEDYARQRGWKPPVEPVAELPSDAPAV